MRENGKKHIVRVWAFFAMTALLLTGCKAKEDGEITGGIFDRGHGSAWGNQFYIEVCADEIVLARYFPENSQDQETCEHILITPKQWSEICVSIQSMDLQEDRIRLWQDLWKSHKLDGGGGGKF